MNVVMFTGLSCVGKTTICSMLNTRLEYEFIPVHPILRQISSNLGYAKTRDWFFEKGTTEISDRLSDHLLDVLSKNKHRDIVLDDLYDVNTMKRVFENTDSADRFLINVTSPYKSRLKRMEKRTSFGTALAIKELKLYDQFKKDSGLKFVISKSTHTIDNVNITLTEYYDKVVQIIKEIDK